MRMRAVVPSCLTLLILLLSPVSPASADWTFKVLDTGRLNDVFFVNELTGWVVGDSGKIFKTTDGGDSWAPQPRLTLDHLYAVSFVDTNIGYVVGDMNTVLKTTDGGANWNLVTTTDFSMWVNVHFADEQTGWIQNSVDFGDGSIRKTTDGGSTWIDQPELGSVWDMDFREGTKGWLTRQDTISTTTDGTTWDHDTVVSQFTIDRIAVPTDSVAFGVTLLGVSGFSRVSKSTDGGASWDTVASFNTAIRGMSFTSASEGWVSGGGHSGGIIDHTTDAGATWVREVSNGVGHPFYGVFGRSHFLDNNHGWVAGFTIGLSQQCLVARYRNPTTGIDDAPALASEYSLAQNYPNPFNPTTSIDYVVPVSGTVTLSVFNMLGQNVAELVDGFQEPGRKSVAFDASHLPSGMYTYRITAGSFTESRKMLLVR